MEKRKDKKTNKRSSKKRKRDTNVPCDESKKGNLRVIWNDTSIKLPKCSDKFDLLTSNLNYLCRIFF